MTDEQEQAYDALPDALELFDKAIKREELARELAGRTDPLGAVVIELLSFAARTRADELRREFLQRIDDQQKERGHV